MTDNDTAKNAVAAAQLMSDNPIGILKEQVLYLRQLLDLERNSRGAVVAEIKDELATLKKDFGLVWRHNVELRVALAETATEALRADAFGDDEFDRLLQLCNR